MSSYAYRESLLCDSGPQAGPLIEAGGSVTQAMERRSSKARRYERISLPRGMLIAWQSSGERTVSRIGTLGLGGLFIYTEEPPPRGEIIKLFFEVPSGDVRARAVVRDSQPGKGMGVEFTAMGAEERARLNRLLKRLIR